jgi:periplasmic divalent cation tolerance protein
MGFIMIYTTHASQEEAQRVANVLLETKRIACANIFPIQSAYWWHGALEGGGEWVALLKTIPENWESVKGEIARLHPYEVPCIIKIEAEANPEYESWIRASCFVSRKS